MFKEMNIIIFLFGWTSYSHAHYTHKKINKGKYDLTLCEILKFENLIRF